MFPIVPTVVNVGGTGTATFSDISSGPLVVIPRAVPVGGDGVDRKEQQ